MKLVLFTAEAEGGRTDQLVGRLRDLKHELVVADSPTAAFSALNRESPELFVLVHPSGAYPERHIRRMLTVCGSAGVPRLLLFGTSREVRRLEGLEAEAAGRLQAGIDELEFLLAAAMAARPQTRPRKSAMRSASTRPDPRVLAVLRAALQSYSKQSCVQTELLKRVIGHYSSACGEEAELMRLYTRARETGVGLMAEAQNLDDEHAAHMVFFRVRGKVLDAAHMLGLPVVFELHKGMIRCGGA